MWICPTTVHTLSSTAVNAPCGKTFQVSRGADIAGSGSDAPGAQRKDGLRRCDCRTPKTRIVGKLHALRWNGLAADSTVRDQDAWSGLLEGVRVGRLSADQVRDQQHQFRDVERFGQVRL